MEKLNELVELAKKATQGKWWIDSHGHSMVSFSGNEMEIVFVTKSDAMSEAKRHDDTGNLSHWRNDNDASFIAAANPKNILAIAEAYRALEQRAEAAEAKYSEVSDWYAKMKTRMLAAEAKLAELEKQNPVAWTDEQELRDVKNHGCGYLFTVDPITPNADPRRIINLFTRPAPAINLAELVPDGWKLVPIEPDWEMLSADGCKEHHNGQPCLHHDNRKRIWSAMLAAAPTPHE